MNSIKIMSDSEKSCRKLQFLVDYMSDQFGVEVETGFESVVELRKIVDTLETRIDSKIGFKSHLFEVSLMFGQQLIQLLTYYRSSMKTLDSSSKSLKEVN